MLLGQRLVQDGLVTPEMLEAALAEQAQHGGRVGSILVYSTIITSDQLAEALAAHIRAVGAAKSAELEAVDRSIVSLVPGPLAAKHRAIPITWTTVAKRELIVAFRNPHDLAAVDEIAFAISARVRPLVAPDLAIARALERHYGIRVDAESKSYKTSIRPPVPLPGSISTERAEAASGAPAAAPAQAASETSTENTLPPDLGGQFADWFLEKSAEPKKARPPAHVNSTAGHRHVAMLSSRSGRVRSVVAFRQIEEAGAQSRTLDPSASAATERAEAGLAPPPQSQAVAPTEDLPPREPRAADAAHPAVNGDSSSNAETGLGPRGTGDIPVARSVDIPVARSGDIPVARSVDIPVARSVDIPVARSGDIPAQRSPEATVPTEDLPGRGREARASGDIAARSSGDVAARSSGDIAARGSGDIAARGSGDIAARGSGDIAARSGGDIAARGSGDIAARGSGDVAAKQVDHSGPPLVAPDAPTLAATPDASRTEPDAERLIIDEQPDPEAQADEPSYLEAGSAPATQDAVPTRGAESKITWETIHLDEHGDEVPSAAAAPEAARADTTNAGEPSQPDAKSEKLHLDQNADVISPMHVSSPAADAQRTEASPREVAPEPAVEGSTAFEARSEAQVDAGAAPAGSRAEEAHPAVVPARTEAVDTVRVERRAPGEASPSKEVSALEPARAGAVAVEAAPAVAEEVAVEAAPVAAEEVAVEAAPVAAEEVAVDAAPVAAEEVAVEAAPAAAEEVAVEAAPAAAEEVAVDAAPAAAEEVAVEAAPVAAEGITIETAPGLPEGITVETTPGVPEGITVEAASGDSEDVAARARRDVGDAREVTAEPATTLGTSAGPSDSVDMPRTRTADENARPTDVEILPVPEAVQEDARGHDPAPKQELRPEVASAPSRVPPAAATPAAPERPALSLAEAIGRIAEAQDRDEIANAIVDHLRTTYGIGLLFIVKDQVAFGWTGFSSKDLSEQAIKSIAISLNVPWVLSLSFTRKSLYLGPPEVTAGSVQSHFYRLIDSDPPREVLVAPIVLKDRVINLVYAQSIGDAPIPDIAVAELTRLCQAAAEGFVRVIKRQKTIPPSPAGSVASFLPQESK